MHELTFFQKELRAHLNSLETKVGRKLILTAAVAAQWTIIETSYKPKEMASYVDFINLMAYDFYIYKWYWPLVGHNSALHPRADDYAIKRTLNTAWAANYWHRLGVPKAQIVVGIPTYGKQFRLQSRHSTRPGALASSSAGDCSYSQVCTFLRSNNTRQVCKYGHTVVEDMPGPNILAQPNLVYLSPVLSISLPHRYSTERPWCRTPSMGTIGLVSKMN